MHCSVLLSVAIYAPEHLTFSWVLMQPISGNLICVWKHILVKVQNHRAQQSRPQSTIDHRAQQRQRFLTNVVEITAVIQKLWNLGLVQSVAVYNNSECSSLPSTYRCSVQVSRLNSSPASFPASPWSLQTTRGTSSNMLVLHSFTKIVLLNKAVHFWNEELLCLSSIPHLAHSLEGCRHKSLNMSKHSQTELRNDCGIVHQSENLQLTS